MYIDPRNGPEWDLPATGRPRQTYVIASTPRSGSTLLCRLLWGTGRVGAPKEYLNPMQLRDWSLRHGSAVAAGRNWVLRGRAVGLLAGRWGPWGRWSAGQIQAHLCAVADRRSSGAWFGLKIHHHHLQRWTRRRTVDDLLGPVRWVRIVRGDVVAQAVSWELALQSGQWASWQAPGGAIYSRRRIARRVRAIEAAEQYWDRLLVGRPQMTVHYATLRASPEATVRSVLRFLDVPGADGVVVPAPGTVPQANRRNADWMARFHSGR